MKKTIKLIIIILLMFNILVFFSSKSEATNPTASISSDVNGDKITVTISFSGPVYGCNLSINAGSLGSETYSSTSSGSKSFTFTANENGTYGIKLSGTVTDNNTNEAVAVSDSTSATITSVQETKIEDTKTETTTSGTNTGSTATQTTNNAVPTSTVPSNIGDKSGNARLKSLSISPVDFTGFKPDKNSGYSVTVENDITEVKVTAVASDSKSTVKISGNKNLQVGNNIVSIMVVAQDGTTNSYQVTVNRKDKDGTELTTTVANNLDIYLNSLSINGVELTPTFQKDVYEYEGTLTQDLSQVDIMPKANDDSVEISIVGNENFNRGKNIITILLSSSKSAETKIYKITLSKEVIDQELINIEQQNSINKQEKKKLIVKIILAAIALLGLALVIIKIKSIVKKKEILPIDFAYFEDEEKEEKKKDHSTNEIDPRTKELFKGKNENNTNNQITQNSEDNNKNS